jgi:hypothetical protein
MLEAEAVSAIAAVRSKEEEPKAYKTKRKSETGKEKRARSEECRAQSSM